MNKTGASIIRRKSETDNYSTPPEAIHALLDQETFGGDILEPAYGEGNIYRALCERTTEHDVVFTSDIRPIESGDIDWHELDFIENTEIYHEDAFHSIVTNPPFSMAQAFAEKALVVSSQKVALLLRIQFLESEKRYQFLKSSPLKAVHIFPWRVSMYPEGFDPEAKRATGTQCFAWFVWEHGWDREPCIRWIPPREK